MQHKCKFDTHLLQNMCVPRGMFRCGKFLLDRFQISKGQKDGLFFLAYPYYLDGSLNPNLVLGTSQQGWEGYWVDRS